MHFFSGDESSISVRLRYLDETQRLVQTHLDETIGDFKRYLNYKSFLFFISEKKL